MGTILVGELLRLERPFKNVRLAGRLRGLNGEEQGSGPMDDRRKGGVRALQRGLMVLESLSFSEELSTADVAQRTSLPRATVLRLLETLESRGYVARDQTGGPFRLTGLAAGLGDGLDAGVALGLVSGPILSELGREITWPADVFSYEQGAMIIQESTNARSPLSLDPNRIGGRFPVLASAVGRAFLAACDPQQRRMVLNHLPLVGDPADAALLKDRTYEAELNLAIERGYSLRHGRESNRKSSSIGVAIVQGGRPWGAISTRWLDSALDLPGAVDQLLPALRKAATRIEAEIERLTRPLA